MTALRLDGGLDHPRLSVQPDPPPTRAELAAWERLVRFLLLTPRPEEQVRVVVAEGAVRLPVDDQPARLFARLAGVVARTIELGGAEEWS